MEKIELIYKNRDSFMETGNKTGSLPPEKRKKILKKVTLIHLSLIIIPCTWYAISYFFIPKRSIIKVTLVSAPPPAASTPTVKRDAVQQPPPPLKHTAKKHLTTKRVAKQPSKPIKKQQSKWKPKSLKEITISKKIIKNTKTVPQKTVTHRVSANDIESKLRKFYTKNSNKAPLQASHGNVSANYRDKLYTAIYKLWDQPARSELGGKYPVVDITMTVESNGRVSSSRISQKSGIKAMDSSVIRLLQKLKQLPPPSAGRMTFTVSLEIVD